MTIFIGMILFIVGTLAAFVVATAGIAYLRTLSVYIGMRKLYRVSFGAGMLTIAVLISTLIAQMLISGSVFNTAEDVVAVPVPAAEFQIEKEDAETKVEVAETPSENKKEEASESESKDTPETTAPEIVEEPEAQEQQPVVEQPVAVQPTETRSLIVPSFSVWTNIYKGHEYAYVEIEGGIPYVYAPNNRGSFWYDLNNISSGRESGNIVVMANAGIFNDNTTPRGSVIQNGKVVSTSDKEANIPQTLVIDDTGNVGYTNKVIANGTVAYTDAITGKTVSGRKIASAVTAFSPIVMNNKAATEYKNKVNNYSAYRARSIFCVRSSRSFTIITNAGEGENGGGWNFDDMAEVARRRGCVSAFNLDGGGSTALAWRTSISQGFSTYATTERHDPTFIVFTADNLAPSGK